MNALEGMQLNDTAIQQAPNTCWLQSSKGMLQMPLHVLCRIKIVRSALVTLAPVVTRQARTVDKLLLYTSTPWPELLPCLPPCCFCPCPCCCCCCCCCCCASSSSPCPCILILYFAWNSFSSSCFFSSCSFRAFNTPSKPSLVAHVNHMCLVRQGL